jgi:hypothetical protein
LRIKWEHTRNILKGGGVREEDFVQVRTLFKDYTHIIKLEISSIITKFIIIAHAK